MPIAEVFWSQERVDHIAQHGVRPEEFRAKATGPNPVYYVLGETDAGRLLFSVAIEFPGARGYPVTARG